MNLINSIGILGTKGLSRHNHAQLKCAIFEWEMEHDLQQGRIIILIKCGL